MISFDDACALVLAQARPLGVEHTPVADALGRVLAKPVQAQSDFPPNAVSTMDGWAVRDDDLANLPARLHIAGESRPEVPFVKGLNPGECARVFTGAAVPENAQRVVMQEIVRPDGDHAVFETPPSASRFLRNAGDDFRAGEELLPAGTPLMPQALVAAAAADYASVETWRRPQILILSTGDELAEPGQAHKTAHRIPDSASVGVAALATAWGAHVIGRERLKDDLDAMVPAANIALDRADVVVVIGGASMGDRDFARAMFEPLGLAPIFSKVAMKPGKPVWFGRVAERLVLGLPGNPTSAFVTARLFLAPLVAGLSGRDPRMALSWRAVRLAAPLDATDDRETFWRATLNRGGNAEPLPDQASGAQKALARSQFLIRRRPGAKAAARHDVVDGLDL
ncbi:MAG TPA: molybdopterin molybdotransferase MoeA [Caulobacteraceae bacterium]|jgi:molybdopterin molybdotransferase|nr:molybdopterin molybdotransferase MoeA [Caulobacteraceae bacterium]